MEGWVSFHRKITKWEWYDDANTFRLFFHLVLMANNEDGNWRGIKIKKGQHLTSQDHLASALKLSRQQIRLSINKLKSTNEITIEATNKYSLVTVVNYTLYQTKKNKRTNKPTIKPTNEQPTDNHQTTTNNNEDNENNENNKNIIQTNLEIAINDFVVFRKKIKNPMTDKAIELLNTRLNKLADDEETKIEILEQSIMNGWKGVFELKESKPKPQQKGLRGAIDTKDNLGERWKPL